MKQQNLLLNAMTGIFLFISSEDNVFNRVWMMIIHNRIFLNNSTNGLKKCMKK